MLRGSDEVALSALSEALSSLRLRHETAERAMRWSLAERGQLTPVLCFATEAGALEVFDGFKRLRAARQLGWPSLRIERIATDGLEAKLSLWEAHAGRGLSEIEEAWLLRSLHRDDGLPQHELARRLRRHKSWVCRRLMLAECLGDEVEGQLRLGLLSATVARELCRLPRGNQAKTAEVVTHRGLTTRQTTKLVDALLAAPDAVAAARVLDETREGPSARPHARKTPGEKLVDDAVAIQRRSARLHVQLVGRPLLELGLEAAELAVERLETLRATLKTLCGTIDQVIADKEVEADYVIP